MVGIELEDGVPRDEIENYKKDSQTVYLKEGNEATAVKQVSRRKHTNRQDAPYMWMFLKAGHGTSR